ncbi:hypothetical protein AVEN_107864-1 [Araneus ventricosus]|uniref:Uncharacterized protein n=1 Tax=Araneus ventricosus TaxID=182803 RepID=A0A4Y2QCS3_ARAVE|nr:hypothetical protein AVEN_107864-1 [Araneus ventricosus]
MLLILDDIHKRHLDLLKTIDEKIVREFCRISVEHLFKGSNSKVYQSAAQRLNVETDIVQNAITGIMQLLIEASKAMVFPHFHSLYFRHITFSLLLFTAFMY